MLDVVTHIAPEAKHLRRLDAEVAREVAPALAFDVVRVRRGEAKELLAHGLRPLGAHRPPAHPVRDRVLEPARLGDVVDALGPDRQAVEILAEHADVVHARLDGVQERVEAARAAELVDARGAALQVGAELGELADALPVVGVLDEDALLEAGARDRPVVGGHAPAGERRQGGVAGERDRPREPGPQVGPRAVGAELAVEVSRGTQSAMGQQCIAGDHAAFLPALAGIEPLGIATRGVQNEQRLAALARSLFSGSH